MTARRRSGRTAAAGLATALLLWLGPAAAGDGIVSVGGQRLHIETLGASGPAVVFEAGLGNDASTWDRVAGPISEFARVVLYDRPGLGASLPMTGDAPVTADAVATRLRALLTKADVSPPWILVGHSLGGLYVQMFARKYPDEVAGVVLIDSSSAEAPPELKTRAVLLPGTAAFLEEAGVAESNRQVLGAGPFPDVPLMVIAATDHGPFFSAWEPTLMRLQEGLATLSPLGELVVADGSGHDVQIDRPQLVIEAVRRMAAP